MKTILAFETSSPILSVALGTREGKIKGIRSRGHLRHAEDLIPLADRLLKKEKLSIREIDTFAIDRGPGSFTGLRIGFSFLKGFLTARKRPCYGALSLDMIAARIPGEEGLRLGVLVDARRERIYARFYRFDRGQWQPERVGVGLVLYEQLKSHLSKETLLVGDALERYGEILKKEAGKKVRFVNAGAAYDRMPLPSASTLVEWFHSKNPRLALLRNPQDLIPLYFRSSEAEENRSRAKKHGP